MTLNNWFLFSNIEESYNWLLGLKIVKFPVFFPVSREFGLESGSL